MMKDEPRYALLSVFDKTGIVEFAQDLIGFGFVILSLGGTAKVLAEAGIAVMDVSELTGMEAILSHRVVTLHPKIHGGLLALPTTEHDMERAEHGIPWIELVCVDFYPLEEAVAKATCTSDVIEMVDIGGPTMIMAGAKGNRIVICNPEDRKLVIELLENGADPETFKQDLITLAFDTVSSYYGIGAKYFDSKL